ncbi:MAG: response regulator [Halobacteriovoraceae bacterium]|nr:response regulator [Halobacteriovoraceae bacterium]
MNKNGLESILKVFDLHPEGIVVVTQSYEIVFWNKQLEISSNINSSELKGSVLFERFPKFENPIIKTRLDSIFLGAPVATFTAAIHHHFIPIIDEKTEKFRKQKMNAHKFTFEDENFLVLIIYDLTNAEKKNEIIKELKKNAEEASMMKSLFIANISHEIRTPLNSIIGISEVLSGEVSLKEISKFSKILNRVSNILLSLVNNVLDLSKIEAGEMTIENSSFDLKNLLTGCKEIFESECDNKKNTFQLVIDEDIPRYIIGDSTRLTQVLINLLSNAIKFTSEGKIILFVTKNDENENVFIVTDTGVGIEEDKLDSIFELYIQEDASIERKYGGTGLGLNISRNIVRLMGGELQVESLKGQGATFYFSIPLKEDHSVKELNTNLINSNKDMLEILLVDDEVEILEFTKNDLESLGFAVTCVHSAEEALGILDDNVIFDLIISDIKLPKIGGIELYKILRSKHIITPFIFFSGFVDSDTIKNHIKIESLNFINKPVDVSEDYELQDLLLNLADKGRRNRQLQEYILSISKITPISILYIDDSLDNIILLETFLSNIGVSIESCLDGKEGLQKLMENDYSLAIIDLQMPGPSGFDIIQELRKFEEKTNKKRIPSIAFSASMTIGKVKQSQNAGFDLYLPKPASKLSIFKAINDLLINNT